ncbi:hypothetical protein CO038_04725 [Candidatus Pacearchaeota archaeon CG_4_9_14_0_2_um_filter_39_13]|nr:hypothetical protein [Candidatus Pacearchaeota archaeon]OIO42513.1 MAG: hypothetical protein AUJ64_03920 [Candidatus Pacearchaeota archaeon CG1_02_39_14]PJC44261.1 MAG: hypothetical protein CO038_04725 [Candidatus Pacearchaeota archaeon CG_4_9_14_0_2_um_filter_39_13]
MKNSINRIFGTFNRLKISYLIRGRYKHLPDVLDGGDVDLLIKQDDIKKAKEIIRREGFRHYPYTQPNLFYLKYDKSLGLILLDVLPASRFPEVKKHKTFFIPKDDNKIPNKKPFLHKIYTGIRRRAYFLFRGPLIIFEGPDGSGKTTNAKALYESLKRFPMKKEFIHFATPFKKDGAKPSSFDRARTRMTAIIKVWKNRILGRLTITDRYIYLTFRKKPFLRDLIRTLAPKPNALFLMKADVKTIRKRKEGQRDQLSEEMIKELYKVYEDVRGIKIIEIDTKKPIDKNLERITNLVLEICCRK